MPGDILFLGLLKSLVTDQFKAGSMNYNKNKLKLVSMLSIQLEGKTRSQNTQDNNLLSNSIPALTLMLAC